LQGQVEPAAVNPHFAALGFCIQWSKFVTRRVKKHLEVWIKWFYELFFQQAA
jgi:hypothetical protein